MQRLAASLMACALVVASGCSFTPQPETQASSACDSSASCLGGRLCRQGYCVLPSVGPASLAFEFVPPRSSGYLPQRSQRATVEIDNLLPFQLSPAVPLDGRLFDASNPQSDTALRPELNGQLVLTAADPNSRQTLFVRQGRFNGQVTPGVYDVLFRPFETTLPERRWGDLAIEAEFEFNAEYPSDEDFWEIAGRVLQDNDLPVVGAEVVATREDGTLSSRAVSDNFGNFSLRVLPEPASYTVALQGAAPGSLIPSIRSAAEVTIERIEDASSTVNLRIGTLPTDIRPVVELQFSAIPQGELSGAVVSVWTVLPQAIAGTSSRLVRKQETLQGLETTILFSELPVGEYTVQVIPATGSPWATTRRTITITGETTSVALDLDPRAELRGQVLDDRGGPIVGARVEVAQDVGLQPGGTYRHLHEVLTGEDGRFTMFVEPQNDLIRVVPPLDTRLASHTERLDIAAAIAAGELTLQLRSSVLVYGAVLKDNVNASPLVDTVVRVLAVVSNEEVVVGEATTDPTGLFRVPIEASFVELPGDN